MPNPPPIFFLLQQIALHPSHSFMPNIFVHVDRRIIGKWRGSDTYRVQLIVTLLGLFNFAHFPHLVPSAG
jgi:hypothetical protein